MTPAPSHLVLSLFPGIGLLCRGFEDAGFCVVRGPDKLWGGDVRKFHPPDGHITGIIGGPPCQNFCTANRKRDAATGMELVLQFLRVVVEAQPEWWLMENVPGSPDLETFNVQRSTFNIQRFTLDASHVGSDQHRLRKFHFGYRPGSRELVIPRAGQSQPGLSQPTCMGSEARRAGRRSWEEFCRLQGLPEGFDLPGFTVAGKYTAVGNGVPYPMALALATAIRNRDRAVTPHRVCACGCGRFVTGREVTSEASCRKREQRRRDASRPATPAESQLALA